MGHQFAWEDLTVIGTPEGPLPSGTVDFAVGPALVRAKDGRRFVITSPRAERPAVRCWVGDGEFAERSTDGTFAILKEAWPARQAHVVVSVSAAFVRAMAAASLAFVSAAQEAREDGWTMRYVSLSDLADARVTFARAFLLRIESAFKPGSVEDADEVGRWLSYARVIARDGSFEHAEAFVLSVLWREREGADAEQVERLKGVAGQSLRMNASVFDERVARKRAQLQT